MKTEIYRMRFPRCALLVGVLLGLGVGAGQSAGLRLAHLSPDAPEVDMLIDGRLILKDVAFGEVSGYLTLPAGRHEITLFPHRLPRGNTEGVTGGLVLSEEAVPSEPVRRARPLQPIITLATVEVGAYYTVALSGFYEPPPLVEALGNLSVNVEPAEVTFSITGPHGYGANFVGDQLIEGLEPGSYVVTAGLDGYKTTTYEVQVQPDDTDTLSVTLQREEVETEAWQPVAEGEQTLLWQKAEIQVYRDELPGLPPAGRALLRVVHASPITPVVDVVVSATTLADLSPERETADGREALEGGESLVNNLTFPNLSLYADVPAAPLSLRLRSSRTGEVLADVPNIPILPGMIYTFYLVGDPVDNYLQVITSTGASVVYRPVEGGAP